MARKIVLEQGGASSFLEEVAARDEEQLQERLKLSPELLPVEDFGLSGPVMVIGRETALPSGWVDLLCLARSGEIIVVEFKTGPQNPDFRHAFAQLLDYGSDLWGMTYDVFESSVAVRYFNSAQCSQGSPVHGSRDLAAACRTTWPDLSDEGLEALRDKIVRQLISGGFHYVLVAQRFSPSTEQTVRYLNESMPRCSFFAVEMVRFTGDGSNAFEARTVVRPASSTSSSGPGTLLDEMRFLDGVGDDAYRTALQELLEACRGLGLRFEWGTKGTSIRLLTPDRTEPVSVGWLFPGTGGWMGLRDLTLGFDPATAANTPTVRSALDAYVERARQIPGAVPVKQAALNAYHVMPPTVVTELDRIRECLGELVAEAGGGAESA